MPPANSTPIILAEKLTKTYQTGKVQVTAVRGLSLSVEPGEFVAIVGPSGSGKSTLFYLLGGLTRATTGRVVIDGIDFATLDDAARTRLRRHRIGFVFQKFNLLPTLSAMGNIEIAYAVSGAARDADGPEVPGSPERDFVDSGAAGAQAGRAERGEQQRVAIARALITRPAIVLADEPTGNLDTKNSDAVLQMLLRSNRELGQTTLMITHNPEAAAIAEPNFIYEGRADCARGKGFAGIRRAGRKRGQARFDLVRPPGILRIAPSGSSSVVEHRLAKARVASSNLVSRSKSPSGAKPGWLR